MQPASMTSNLSKVESCMLYGKNIMDYSKEELAAFIIHQTEQRSDMMEEKARQFQNLISIRKWRL